MTDGPRDRLKAYILLVYGWVKDELAAARDEIAPQLRGVSLPNIPDGAVKPLALAGILIISALVMPAAPFGGGEQLEDPVEGETFESVNQPTLAGATLNQLPSSYLGTSDEAPDPPDQVRASAGSQTMQVQTSVVDGEPAIVLEDDRTHDGRWVALKTSWFEEHVGEIPSAAYVEHESGETYAAPLQVRGESAAFYVREFSTNTVTFSGEVRLSGSQAVDGTQYQYELNDTSGVEDPTINLTGENNTLSESKSNQLSDGDSLNMDIGGTVPPENGSVTLTGVEQTSEASFSTGLVSDGYTETINIGGNQPARDATVTLTGSKTTDTFSGGFKSTDSESYSFTVDGEPQNVELEYESTKSFDTNVEFDTDGDGNAEIVKEIPDGASGSLNIDDSLVDSGQNNWDIMVGSSDIDIEVTGDEIIQTRDPSVSGDGWSVSHFGTLSDGESVTESVELSPGSQSLSVSTTGNVEVSGDWTEVTATEDPSVTINGSTTSHAGILDPGESVSESVDLDRGFQSADVSVNGPVDVSVSWTEISQTVDPVVELNGETVGVDGTLSDGETVTLSQNASALQEGTNRVNISTNSPSSGPASLVGFEYSHGAETTVSGTVDAGTWNEVATVQKTWAGDRANATATIPMNDRVVDVDQVEIRYNETTWQTVSDSEFALDGTDLTVQLGDVAAGSTTEVRATGSKVRVTDGSISVLNATTTDGPLNTTIAVDSAGPNFAIHTAGTRVGDRVTYAENATWGETNDTTTFTSSGEQTMTLPGATAGGETTVKTWPIAVSPATDSVTITDTVGERDTEPGVVVNGDGNAGVSYTYLEAQDATPYVLYSETNGIVRDEGLASSPITLTDDNSAETLVFRVDDGTASGSSSSSGAVAGAVAPMVTNNGGFNLSADLTTPLTILVSLVGIVGALFVSRRLELIDTTDRGDTVAGVARSTAQTLLGNEIIVGGAVLAGGVYVATSASLPEQTKLILALASVPVAMFLALRQFGQFDIRIWGGSTALVAVFGLQQLAPELFQTIADEAGIIIVVGGILLGWRALSAWRADANTPDQVTTLEIQAQEDDDQ